MGVISLRMLLLLFRSLPFADYTFVSNVCQGISPLFLENLHRNVPVQQNRLSAIVEKEEFEEAAKLRDMIREIKKKEAISDE